MLHQQIQQHRLSLPCCGLHVLLGWGSSTGDIPLIIWTPEPCVQRMGVCNGPCARPYDGFGRLQGRSAFKWAETIYGRSVYNVGFLDWHIPALKRATHCIVKGATWIRTSMFETEPKISSVKVSASGWLVDPAETRSISLKIIFTWRSESIIFSERKLFLGFRGFDLQDERFNQNVPNMS